jgi:restriction system protein
MAIPKYHELFLPVLQILADEQEWRAKDLYKYVIDNQELSEEDLSEKYGGGGNRALGRAYFACEYLFQSGALKRPKRAHWQITGFGQKMLAEHPEGISLACVMATDGFKDWARRSRERAAERRGLSDADKEEERLEKEVPPDELIDAGVNRLRDTVATELLDRIRGESPRFLEEIVLKVLHAMGYGEGEDDMTVLGGPGDEGVDGVIKQDTLGLDQIYVQAKRRKEDSAIGPENIQSFIGAVHNKGASRGVFITTSRFTTEAKKAAEKYPQPRIILVDGNKLADFMLEHEIGVTVDKVFTVYKIDEDFFEEFGGS